MVPAVLEESEMELELPEQIVCELGVVVIEGLGLTVIVTAIGVPLQPFAVGVTE